MILINLLPHREAARKRRRDVFNVSLGFSALVGGLIAGGIFLWYEEAISVQQSANSILKSEIAKLDGQIKDIAGLETEIAALRARQQAVEDLQSDRNLPVHMLTELVNQLPDGTYITKMNQSEQLLTITGTAQSNERVSELLRNLANNTPWFSKPELVEIVSGTVNLSPRETKRVSNFSIRVRLMRSSDVQKAAAAAAAAAKAQTGTATLNVPTPTTPVSVAAPSAPAAVKK